MKNDPIHKALRKIKDLDEKNQNTFIRALQYSLVGDGKLPPKVYSADEISELTQIPLKVLHNYHIILSKKQAYEYLKEYDYASGYSSYIKKTTEKRYNKVFKDKKDKISKVGNKIVLTYLETHKMEGIPSLPPIPKEIE